MRRYFLLLAGLLWFSAYAAADSLSERLSSVFDRNADEILDPELAFRIDSRVIDANTLEIRWDIEPGYYLYRDKFAFTSGHDSITVGTVRLPEGKLIDDPLFGKVAIHTGEVGVRVPLHGNGDTTQTLDLEVAYQGCKKDSVCYPPIKKTLNFNLAVATPVVETPVSEQDAITRRLTEGGLLANIAVFFGFGLLLSLTPCVFPMIPILSGVIVGQGERLSTRAAFGLSLVYVLAMALTYSVLGVIAGSFHIKLQAAAQNAWIISIFSLVFVVLALSMFGLYEIQLPAIVRDRLHALSSRQDSGNIAGVAIMGVLSAIIVGPCVAPPLAGALLYISQTGNAVLGGLALFAMGLGFGVPLLAIGTSAGRFLPRAGAWMKII
ncbi:MAG: protein-disulfide reductase DsbD, partial [Gammaproteobacteria bacterium]|nr:protein-disulfide reductase DsbD [Gammaproteobacteria bacterium]